MASDYTTAGVIGHFGINTTASIISGSVQVRNLSVRGSEAVLKSSRGATIGKSWFDTNPELQMEYVLGSASQRVPVRGELCVITDSTETWVTGSYRVEDWTSTPATDGFEKINMRMVNYGF